MNEQIEIFERSLRWLESEMRRESRGWRICGYMSWREKRRLDELHARACQLNREYNRFLQQHQD